MAFKIFTVFCVSVLLIQNAYGQIAAGIGAPWGLAGGWNGLAGPGIVGPGLAGPGLVGPGLAGPGLVGPGLAGPGLAGYGCGCGGVASTGGGLAVTSVSPIAPTGVSVFSENAYEGSLCVGGNLPLLGTVALEGVLPTAGAGAVSYGCGDGVVGIAVEEGPIVTGIVPNAAPGWGGIGYNGIAGVGYGPGCGCGYGIY